MMVRKVFHLVLVMLLAGLQHYAFAQGENEQMKNANEFYKAGEYKNAMETYESIVNSGLESAALYYNLGNAYYKMNQPTKAILNFERALLLDPKNENIRYNLSIANESIVDKTKMVPEPPFTKFQNLMLQRHNADGWGYRSLIGFLLSMILIGVFLFSESVGRKRLSFFVAVICLIFSAFTFKFAATQRAKIDDHNEAIIFEASVTVKGSPNENGTELFIVHEGLKVGITDKLGEWLEIRLSDGNKGWVPASVLVRI